MICLQSDALLVLQNEQHNDTELICPCASCGLNLNMTSWPVSAAPRAGTSSGGPADLQVFGPGAVAGLRLLGELPDAPVPVLHTVHRTVLQTGHQVPHKQPPWPATGGALEGYPEREDDSMDFALQQCPSLCVQEAFNLNDPRHTVHNDTTDHAKQAICVINNKPTACSGTIHCMLQSKHHCRSCIYVP